MVGTGLPEETQTMLTESPSCTVTVPFRFMVAGATAVKYNFVGLHCLDMMLGVANAYHNQDASKVCKEVSVKRLKWMKFQHSL